MNWGHGVTIAFALFVGYIMYLVIGCLNQDVHLVAEDYYAQEVAYQGRINALKNAEPFESQIEITQQEGKVNVKMPVGIISAAEEGTVHFFRPSDKTKDVILDLKENTGNVVALEKSALEKGRYEVQIAWSVGGQSYFVKRDLFI